MRGVSKLNSIHNVAVVDSFGVPVCFSGTHCAIEDFNRLVVLV